MITNQAALNAVCFKIDVLVFERSRATDQEKGIDCLILNWYHRDDKTNSNAAHSVPYYLLALMKQQ